jgi:hypothetical protein
VKKSQLQQVLLGLVHRERKGKQVDIARDRKGGEKGGGKE